MRTVALITRKRLTTSSIRIAIGRFEMAGVKLERKTLKLKERRFVEEYVKNGGNASDAYRKAGYKNENQFSVRAGACSMLKKPHIAEAIAKRVGDRDVKFFGTPENIMSELCKIGFSDIRKFYTAEGHLRPIQDLQDDIAGAVSGVDIRTEHRVNEKRGDDITTTTTVIKLWPKMDALKMLAMMLGFLHPDGTTVQVLNKVNQGGPGVLLIPGVPDMKAWQKVVKDAEAYRKVERAELEDKLEKGELFDAEVQSKK